MDRKYIYRFTSENDHDNFLQNNYTTPHLSSLENGSGEVLNVYYNSKPGENGYAWCYYNITTTESATKLFNTISGITGKFKYKDGKWVLFKANDNEIDTSSFATVATSGDYNDLVNKPNIQGFERESNKITTISENATDTQYPSEKSVYDIIVENERVISDAINDLNDRVNELNQKITNEGV